MAQPGGRIARATRPARSWLSRLHRSLQALASPPGRLTREWLAGRRTPYLSPIALFLYTNVAFFIVQSASGVSILSWPLAVHLDNDVLGLVRPMFDAFRESAPAEHLQEYSQANISFHQAIIGLSGSHLMGHTLDNLFLHVRAIRRMTIAQKDRATRSIVDHMRIIEALERRDTEGAERLVREHSLDLAAHVEKHCDFLT